MSQALATTFTNAFPGVKQTINISDKLILSHDVAGLYPSLTAFAQFLRPITQEILGGSYPGVTIVMTPNGISALDGNVKQGQPTTIQTYTYNGVSYPVTDGSITVPATMLADQGFVNSFGTSLLGTATTLVSSKPDADGNVTFISVVPNGSQQVAAVPSAPPSDAPQAKPVQLAFQDLIGQPTWIASGIIQFVCPMRADLSVGAVVIMPKGILGNPTNPAGAPGAVVTTSASQPQARQSSLFSGNFFVTSVHHIGEFRNPDGQGWVTVFNAATQPVAS